ncbi:metallophosphoesterase [Methylobacterium fujisawaense]|uniref:metallophosphoesterase n=1 Tax=Methylobacterium fujisawaense TaxID=107400 RepID=UPI0031F5A25F
MRIWIFSDLHRDLSRAPWTPGHIPDADVAVVAGDVGQGLARTVLWLAEAIRPLMPVVVVPGNHEYYSAAMDEERVLGRRAAERHGVTLLDDDTVEVGGVAFSGGTLWTDYAIDGAGGRRRAMAVAQAGLNDHRCIAKTRNPGWQTFRPADAAALHAVTRGFLERALLERDPPDARARPHVVVTHHAPARGSLDPSYAGSPLNPAFASDLGDLIAAGRPDLWVHGHVHACRDHRIGPTRILCNPLGYDGENGGFDPGCVVEVPS